MPERAGASSRAIDLQASRRPLPSGISVVRGGWRATEVMPGHPAPGAQPGFGDAKTALRSGQTDVPFRIQHPKRRLRSRESKKPKCSRARAPTADGLMVWCAAAVAARAGRNGWASVFSKMIWSRWLLQVALGYATGRRTRVWECDRLQA